MKISYTGQGRKKKKKLLPYPSYPTKWDPGHTGTTFKSKLQNFKKFFFLRCRKTMEKRIFGVAEKEKTVKFDYIPGVTVR